MDDDEYCRYKGCKEREKIGSTKSEKNKHTGHYGLENLTSLNEASKELKMLITQALAKGSMSNLAELTEKKIKEIEII